MLLVRMLVGCNLAFNLILSSFSREFIQRIRPGFARYLPKSTWAFRHTWMHRVFDQVSKKVKERHTSWCAQGCLRTLTLDGVKDNDGGKVNNIGDVINGFALFVWSFPAALHETAVVIKCQVIKALRRAKDDIDCPIVLNDANVLGKYAGVSSDNTSAMRHGVLLHNTPLSPRCYKSLGTAYIRMDDTNHAVDSFEKCLEIQRQLGNDNGVVDALISLGLAYFKAGDNQTSVQHLEDALTMFDQLPPEDAAASSGKAVCLDHLGNVYRS